MEENKEKNIKIKLIEKISENRGEQYEMLDKIKQFRSKLDEFIPDSKEYRSRYLAQEKIKAATDIIKAELEVRKSIDASLIKEIDLRSKYDEESMTESEKENVNIANMSVRDIANFLKTTNNDENE